MKSEFGVKTNLQLSNADSKAHSISQNLRKLVRTLALTGILATAVSCGRPPSTNLMPAPLKIKEVNFKSAGLTITHEATVDILFVLDNSKSMNEELGFLKSNISSFVSSFSENTIIDYHIGVVKVHDSVRYNNQAVLKVHPETGATQYLEKGELSEVNGRRFIDRTNIADLTSLFDIETPYEPRNQWLDSAGKTVAENSDSTMKLKTAAIGPEFEESFSPVIGALTDSKLLASTNQSFHRPGSHLVVIFVTDAEDSTPDLSPQLLFEQLFALKGEDISKLSAYGVLCKNGDSQCLTLKKSGGTIESNSTRIQEFIKIVSRAKSKAVEAGRIAPSPTKINPILNLTSNTWGRELSEIGGEIRRTTLEKTIPLGEVLPEYDPVNQKLLLEVRYGEQIIDYNEETGWTYDATTNSITVHSGVVYTDPSPEAKISIKLTQARNPKGL